MENKCLFRHRYGAFIALGAIWLAGISGAHSGSGDPAPAMESALESALVASHERGEPFFLRVDCTSDKGARNLELFPDGIAIWDNRVELEMNPDQRSALAGLLIDREFASLDPEYGGKAAPDERKAPLRVSCAIEFRTNAVSKRSQQYVDGFQSGPLNGLANALLDRVAPLAEAHGVGTDSLAQGLKMLAAGDLSAHGFRLNFVELPADRSTGRIMQINGDTARIRAYRPGVEVGEAASFKLDAGRLKEIANALRNADIESLPINLWSARQLELEVEMLDRKKTLLAREFMRLSPESLGEMQHRFDSMIERLRQIRSELESGASP